MVTIECSMEEKDNLIEFYYQVELIEVKIEVLNKIDFHCRGNKNNIFDEKYIRILWK